MSPEELNSLSAAQLAAGKQYYGLPLGIVSRILNDRYMIFNVDSYTGMPDRGSIYDLQAVYCNEVYEGGETVAITEIDSTPGMCLHPLYASLPCEVYISTPLMVNGQVWGTLNYTSLEIREQAFSTQDIGYIEEQGAAISAAIERSGLDIRI